MADETATTTLPPADQPPVSVVESDSPSIPEKLETLEDPLPEVTESPIEEEPPLALPQQPPIDTAKSADVLVVGSLQAKEGGEPTIRKSVPQSLVSFKEESNIVADLSDSERKALLEFKQLVQEALNTHQFTSPKQEVQETKEKPTPKTEEDTAVSESETKPLHEPKIEENPVKEAEEVAKETSLAKQSPEEVSIWGVPLLKDDRSDVILLKFLRARDFKVKDAFIMLRNTIHWRKQFGIDALVEEDLGDDLEKVVFMHGYDREGHPVCYNVFGEFQNKELYQKTFLDEEKRTKFLRWRVQFLERSIRKLDFRPGGVCTIFQVNDLKNSPGPAKSELRLATKQALQLLQDNYPEFVAKQVFINAPWWYLAFYTLISPFLTQRTKSKFVFAGPAKSADTLFRYISAEHVPIQYGGLSVDYCECNPEFTIADPVAEVTIKPGTKKTVEIIIYEKCTIVWELRVVGWEVNYGAEFVPDSQGAYTLIIQKPTKISPNDEPVMHHRFKVSELGKILLTIDNPSSKKKRLLYRFKIEPSD
ncbi:patellin-3 [Argentina anserina]|uniref:patellin-3 n=1 Tax=Argentina anserina TaxID=57926 RepID=UPI0021763FEA|nr:patellin-3 [Potentilla anserina]